MIKKRNISLMQKLLVLNITQGLKLSGGRMFHFSVDQ